MEQQAFRYNREYLYVADFDALPGGVTSVLVPRKGLYVLKVLVRYARQQNAWVDSILSDYNYLPPDDEDWDGILATIDEMEGYLMAPYDKVLADVTLATPETYIDVSGLDYKETGQWDLTLSLVNALEETITVSFYVNGIFTPTLYNTQILLANGTAVAAGRSNSSAIVGLLANGWATVTGIIDRDPDAGVKFLMQVTRYDGDAIDVALRSIGLGGQQGNLTSIRIVSSLEDGLGVGTRLTLLQRGV